VSVEEVVEDGERLGRRQRYGENWEGDASLVGARRGVRWGKGWEVGGVGREYEGVGWVEGSVW